ncbi:MAG: 2Fe-2S iron-sulfur cluster binding domain-containing protein [Vitreoscilla sp.]|nr:2Fe-2S iron-sulfur cluster binding domain-containing protein [Burkholderiales bacterium]MBP6337046.1 2Fe-2S iron-sulfur cluster binding domain-containing protein [Vitreoscilla sp.]MBP6675233.1 2Fe-2S iron-sulfur cluster binding domain-containing protein [Vitreoscilla sp.]
MAQWVTVWRAAQLVGVPRGVLQQRVRAGEIPLADGMVSTETLLQLYPQTDLESSGMLERVVRIRDEAFGKRLRERLLPSQEVLAQRLFAQGQELADVQRLLQRYHALVIALRDEMAAGAAQDTRLAALLRQLNDGLARALATESVGMLDVMDDVLKMVSAQVTLRPSGHQFSVEGRDTLLQAGMRAGLKLNYGCGNGSCGMCKVRVIDGMVARTMHTDYVLSETEKSQGYVLACAHTAASSELTMETLEANGPADIPQQHIVTTVRAVRELAPDTRLLHLQTPRSHRLRFLAGQSATLSLPLGEGVRDTLPIASCPCDDRNLHFFIARNEQNALARQVFGGLKAGDAVNLWGPVGEFVLADGQRPLVFVACDTGFAPLKSLIEHALSLDASPSLSLFWLATRQDGHFLANQCRAWSEALDLFEYALFNDPDANAGAHQVVSAIRADLFDIDCDFYLAGPEGFVNTVRNELVTAGVAAGQIFGEVVA